MAINELQDFRLEDLYEKLRLSDEQFKHWLVSMRLLHSSMICACSNQIKLIRGNRGSEIWWFQRRLHRPIAPARGFKVGF